MCLEPKMQQVKYVRDQLANSHLKFRGFKKNHSTCDVLKDRENNKQATI